MLEDPLISTDVARLLGGLIKSSTLTQVSGRRWLKQVLCTVMLSSGQSFLKKNYICGSSKLFLKLGGSFWKYSLLHKIFGIYIFSKGHNGKLYCTK